MLKRKAAISRNGSGSRDPQFEILQIEIMRTNHTAADGDPDQPELQLREPIVDPQKKFTVPQKGYAERGSKKRLLVSDLSVTVNRLQT